MLGAELSHLEVNGEESFVGADEVVGFCIDDDEVQFAFPGIASSDIARDLPGGPISWLPDDCMSAQDARRPKATRPRAVAAVLMYGFIGLFVSRQLMNSSL